MRQIITILILINQQAMQIYNLSFFSLQYLNKLIQTQIIKLKMDTNPKAILNDGNQMPLIGMGMLNFKPNDKTFNINDFIMKAANIGYSHFDVTNNEQAIGDALKLVFDAKRQLQDQDGQKIPDQFQQAFPREKMFISYKVYNTPDIIKNVKQALTKMRLQYFDLVMLNCPMTPPPQVQIPAEGQPPANNDQQNKGQVKRQSMKQAWKLLQKCKQQGLIKSLGVSNFSIQALLNLYPFVNTPPTVNEIQCHPFNLQKNMYQICKKLKITIIAFCPLMRGGKDQKQPLGDKIDYQSDPILKQLGIKYAKTIPQIILNYQICRGVAVIPKTQKLDHLTQNFNITDFQLLDEDKTQFQKNDKGGKLRVYQLKNTPIWKGQDPLC